MSKDFLSKVPVSEGVPCQRASCLRFPCPRGSVSEGVPCPRGSCLRFLCPRGSVSEGVPCLRGFRVQGLPA